MHVCLISSSWVHLVIILNVAICASLRKKSLIHSLNNSVEAIGQTDILSFVCLLLLFSFVNQNL